MTDRIQINTLCFMQLDGQWQLVDTGSVIDVPDAKAYTTVAGPLVVAMPASLLAEAAGTLQSGKATSVRGKRGR